MKIIEVNISKEEKEIYYAISQDESIWFGIGIVVGLLIGVLF